MHIARIKYGYAASGPHIQRMLSLACSKFPLAELPLSHMNDRNVFHLIPEPL